MSAPSRSARLLFLAALVAPALAQAQARSAAPLDVVLVGGRVMDPETNLDAPRTVGIRGGRIASITDARTVPAARDTVDVHGLVIAPGFIDLHAHGQDSLNYAFLARDGVTTALELEVGTYPVSPWYASRAGHALINYGVSVGHPGARRAMLDRDSTEEGSSVLEHVGNFVRASIAADRFPDLERRIDQELSEGALGVGMGINYTPAASRDEIFHVFGVAARHHAPVFVHLRSAGINDTLGGVAGLQEVLADAAATGAPLHVVHVTSMGLGGTPTLLAMINGARSHGMDVTTEAYPYVAGSTYLQTAMFDPGFQQRLGVTYHDLLWTATGERLTEESFARYRKQGGAVVIFMIPESATDQAYRDPRVMVAADAELRMLNGRVTGHPRGAGTHARILGLYVRERHLLTLMDGVRKLTLLPAQRLERVAPMMKRKGRVQVGADADLTVFDPARVADKATFEEPGQASVGIVDVLVGGTFVVRGEQLKGAVVPGRAVRAGAH